MATSHRGDGSEHKSEIGMMIFAFVIALIILPYYYEAMRPILARNVIRLAVLQAHGALLLHWILPQEYIEGLRKLVVDGRQVLGMPGYSAFKTMPTHVFMQALSYASRVYAVIAAGIMGVMAWHIWRTDVRRAYRRTFDLERLIKHLVAERPFLRPIAEVDPTRLDPQKGPWRVKHTYITFATHYGLLLDGHGHTMKNAPKKFLAAGFDTKRATQVFTGLLGPKWNGLETLSPTEQAMFGILAALIARQRKRAIAANDAIAGSFTAKRSTGECTGIDLKPGIALAHEFQNLPEILVLIRLHAYVLPLFMSLKQSAMQRSGRYGTGQYLWLRPIDRQLYLTIHQTGMEVANIETASVYCHWRTETLGRIPSQKPIVTPAVMALRDALIAEEWLVPDHSTRLDPTPQPTAS